MRPSGNRQRSDEKWSGKAVVLEPYLGAYGHLVAFAQADLAYTHIHPNTADQNNGMLTFLGQVAAEFTINASTPHQACTACSCSSPPEAKSTPHPAFTRTEPLGQTALFRLALEVDTESERRRLLCVETGTIIGAGAGGG